MQQQPCQPEQLSAQQAQNMAQQMMVCPVRLVYETQILVQPNDQIQPNQTLFINPNNPPPWIQNRPAQNQVIYVQQMPSNMLQPAMDQNQMYIQQNYPNLQQGITNQMVIQNPNDIRSGQIQFTNVVPSNMMQNPQTMPANMQQVQNLHNNKVLAPTIPLHAFQQMIQDPRNMTNLNHNQINIMQNTNTNQSMPIGSNAQTIYNTNMLNTQKPTEVQTVYRNMVVNQQNANQMKTSQPQQQQQQQQQQMPTQVMIKSLPNQVNPQNIHNLQQLCTNIGQNVQNISMQVPAQNITNMQQMMHNTMSPVNVQQQNTKNIMPNYNNRMTTPTVSGSPNNVQVINKNVNQNINTYRQIHPRPQQMPRINMPNLLPANFHMQKPPAIRNAGPNQIKSANNMQTYPQSNVYNNQTAIRPPIENNVNRKRKSESPDEIQKKITVNPLLRLTNEVELKPIMNQYTQSLSKSQDSSTNTSPVHKIDSRNITGPRIPIQPIEMKPQTNTMIKIEPTTQISSNASTLFPSSPSAQGFKSASTPKEPMKVNDKEKLVRNTVYTQARGRTLSDNKSPIARPPTSIVPKPAVITNPNTEVKPAVISNPNNEIKPANILNQSNEIKPALISNSNSQVKPAIITNINTTPAMMSNINTDNKLAVSSNQNIEVKTPIMSNTNINRPMNSNATEIKQPFILNQNSEVKPTYTSNLNTEEVQPAIIPKPIKVTAINTVAKVALSSDAQVVSNVNKPQYEDKNASANIIKQQEEPKPAVITRPSEIFPEQKNTPVLDSSPKKLDKSKETKIPPNKRSHETKTSSIKEDSKIEVSTKSSNKKSETKTKNAIESKSLSVSVNKKNDKKTVKSSPAETVKVEDIVMKLEPDDTQEDAATNDFKNDNKIFSINDMAGKEIHMSDGHVRKEDRDNYILTHVLDGYVIQESNVAFPIRKPLKEKVIYTNSSVLDSLQIKEEKLEMKTEIKDNSKILNISHLNIEDYKPEKMDVEENIDNPFNSLETTAVKKWTIEQLAKHLTQFSWNDTVNILQEHEIDGESLFLVTKPQLVSIGIDENHAETICDFVKS